MTTFKELGLSEIFLKMIESAGFTEPTEIQEKTIPLVLAGKDVIGGSATGSGKTLAFGAGIIEHLKPNGGIQALILVPTRELAEQVGKALRRFSHHIRAHVAMIYGGVSISPQIDDLQRAEIVVGTPGRILDHMERGTLKLKTIKTLVLDEADRMLDMGFIDDVRTILGACPKERQTLLFSATISQDITQIAKHYMRSPVEISAVEYVDPSKLEQFFYDVPKHMKISLLLHLLKEEKQGLVMVFCNTRHITDFVGHQLTKAGINATPIHGGLTQARRNKIMEQFHAKRVYVLVCTDVAARGLDIKNVSHVYNYDVPKTSKEYIHRIGRTARAGSDGKAITLVSDRDYDSFRYVLRDPSLKIKQLEMPEIAEVKVMMHRSYDDQGDRGGGFRRGSGRGPARGGDRGSRGGSFRGGGRGDSRGGRGGGGRGGSFGGRGRR